MGCKKSISNREVYSDTSLPQQARKISNKQPKLIPKATRENTKNKNRQKIYINFKKREKIKKKKLKAGSLKR